LPLEIQGVWGGAPIQPLGEERTLGKEDNFISLSVQMILGEGFRGALLAMGFTEKGPDGQYKESREELDHGRSHFATSIGWQVSAVEDRKVCRGALLTEYYLEICNQEAWRGLNGVNFVLTSLQDVLEFWFARGS